MKSVLLLCLLAGALLSADLSAQSADDQPGDSAFDQSGFTLHFVIPESFGKPVGGSRGYLQTATGKLPVEDMRWEHEGDTIWIRWMVLAEHAYQDKTPEEMFADTKKSMLVDKALKLISEREYKVSDSPAHSFVFVRNGAQTQYQRVDYIFTKPDLNVVMYTSQKKEALDDPVCRGLFESLSMVRKAPAPAPAK